MATYSWRSWSPPSAPPCAPRTLRCRFSRRGRRDGFPSSAVRKWRMEIVKWGVIGMLHSAFHSLGASEFSPLNPRKPASRDTEGSLKKSPSDSALSIFPHYIGAKCRWWCEAYFFQSPSVSGGAGFRVFRGLTSLGLRRKNTEGTEARRHGGNERLVDTDCHSKSNVRMVECWNVRMVQRHFCRGH